MQQLREGVGMSVQRPTPHHHWQQWAELTESGGGGLLYKQRTIISAGHLQIGCRSDQYLDCFGPVNFQFRACPCVVAQASFLEIVAAHVWVQSQCRVANFYLLLVSIGQLHGIWLRDTICSPWKELRSRLCLLTTLLLAYSVSFVTLFFLLPSTSYGFNLFFGDFSADKGRAEAAWWWGRAEGAGCLRVLLSLQSWVWIPAPVTQISFKYIL